MANKETSVNIFERMIAADSAKVGEVIVCSSDIYNNALDELKESDFIKFYYKGYVIYNGNVFGKYRPKANTAYMVQEENFNYSLAMYGLTLMLN